MLFHEGFDVIGDQSEMMSRHARHDVMLIVEVQTSEEPVEPARGFVIDIYFNLARREAHIFLLRVYLFPWLPVMISNQLHSKCALSA